MNMAFQKFQLGQWPWRWALAGLALALVFALYTRGEFLFVLANRAWACF